MTVENEASHIFHVFLGRNPDDKERADLAKVGVGHDGYIWHDVVHEIEKPIMLMYTSCHAEQFLSYLNQYRPDLVKAHHIVVLFTHRLLLYRGAFSLELVHAIFKKADLIITNPMNPKFEELSTIPLLPLCKPECKVATFVPPSVAAFWPVVEVFGEEPVAKAMKDGLTEQQTVDRFLAGQLDCMFAYRYVAQLDRLKLREKDCDVGISAFINNNLKTHKMFFTANHPTFHLVAWMMNELLLRLGLQIQEYRDPLNFPINAANFTSHYPETDYEWNHYGFQYPKRWENDRGGPQRFYVEIIRKAYQTIKEPEKVLTSPVTPVELEP